MVQLALNQGPQDALLYDNSRSYFTNVGYTRTSNFQIEYRDVDSQSGGDFGSTLQFVIPKAADLLGPVDLMFELPDPEDANSKLNVTERGDVAYASWVDEMGFAAIEKVTFTVGSNDIESITGEQLQLRNELMTSDEMRLGFDQIQKTGRRAFNTLHGVGGKPIVFEIEAATAAAPSIDLLTVVSGTYNVGKGLVRVKPYADAADDAAFILEFDSTMVNGNGGFLDGASPIVRQFGYGFIAGQKRYLFQRLTAAGVTAYSNLTPAQAKTPDDIKSLSFENTDQAMLISSIVSTETVQPHERPGDNSTLPKEFHKKYNKDYSRVIAYKSYSDPASGGSVLKQNKRTLTIPLGLFFTTHASKYFPLAAVAGCNDVRVSVKLRPIKELVQYHALGSATCAALSFAKLETPKLRCHYVHVTGPEATTLMNMEHVRLMQMFQHQPHTFTMTRGAVKDVSIDLSFLHPVTCLLITVRQVQDIGQTDSEGGALSCRKGFFFYHGDGNPPNYDAEYDINGQPVDHMRGGTIKVNSIKLTLNGQDRHPGLSNGVETDYTRSRLIPALHSNSNSDRMHIAATAKNGAIGQYAVNAEDVDYALNGSKNIMIVPFSLNPEGSNPAGAVNMSKVSHAKLTLSLEKPNGVEDPLNHPAAPAAANTDYIVDVHAMYWNWLQIKDGRALLSFA